ncbi:MAG TPA: hypothetical protein VGC66_15565 [Pyrinomonadaceae bacterium]
MRRRRSQKVARGREADAGRLSASGERIVIIRALKGARRFYVPPSGRVTSNSFQFQTFHIWLPSGCACGASIGIPKQLLKSLNACPRKQQFNPSAL